MSYIFEQLQVVGWSQDKENLLLSTLLTGDRALLISEPGSAKSLLSGKLAKAMDVEFGTFDLNSVQFEDMMGFPNVEAAKEGRLEFVKAPGTIWGKKFVTLEEISRIKQTVQGKVLELTRQGTINGMPTGAVWIWANMNPVGSAGSNKLLPALVDRFALVIWAPNALDMKEEDRSKIASATTVVDAPALKEWLRAAAFEGDDIDRFVDTTDYKGAGEAIKQLLTKAAVFYATLSKDMTHLGDFLSMFANTLYNNMKAAPTDSGGPAPFAISGRRLTYLYRTILANRAIELAMDAEFGVYPPSFQQSVQRSLMAAIPYGVNEEEVPHESMRTFINQAFRESFHRLEEKDDEQAELQYRLFCSRDPMERAQLLLSKKIKSPNVVAVGWQRVASMNQRNADLTAFLAIQIDTRLRGAGKTPILPDSVLEILKKRIRDDHVMPELPKLPSQLMPHLKELNDLVETLGNKDRVFSLIAIETAHKFVVENGHEDWKALTRMINAAIDDYSSLMASATS